MKPETPRTDEFARAECYDLEHALDFARDLERELQHCTRQLEIRIRALVERNFARLERDIALEDLANERAYLDRVTTRMGEALDDWDACLYTNETPAYQKARDELATISKFRKRVCVCGFCDGTDCN